MWVKMVSGDFTYYHQGRESAFRGAFLLFILLFLLLFTLFTAALFDT